MNENFILPSEEDSSDSEVCNTFFHDNNVTKVSNAEYQPPTLNSNYSELVPVQISPTRGMHICKITFVI